jgi:hypothetical protein
VIRRLLLLMVSLACCVSLVSCGGNDKKSTSSGPGIPAFAKTNDERGAQRFAQYWIDNLNSATTSGDTKKLRTLQKRGCTTCTDFANRVDGIYAKGGHVVTKGFKTKSLVSEAGIPSPGAGVSATLLATPQTVYPSKNAAPKHYKGAELRLRLILIRSGDHWLMDRIDIG